MFQCECLRCDVTVQSYKGPKLDNVQGGLQVRFLAVPLQWIKLGKEFM